jgi:hypothetical protein
MEALKKIKNASEQNPPTSHAESTAGQKHESQQNTKHEQPKQNQKPSNESENQP